MVMSPQDRVEVLFGRLAELMGQRNAIDAQLVQIAAEFDAGDLAGSTGVRSVTALMAWKTGSSTTNAQTMTAIARRMAEFPRCMAAMREGRLSLDQVGIIAARAGQGSDAHYAQLAEVATVSQLRTAIKLEPRPEPVPDPDLIPDPATDRGPTLTKTRSDAHSICYRLRLPSVEAAAFDAAVQSHRDALVVEYTRDPDNPGGDEDPSVRQWPSKGAAFMRLVYAGWDADVAARPHGQRTSVIVHVDLAQRVAALHLGPLLSDADRRYLLCDATCEVWFERDGEPIGAGRSTRVINRRLRRALEHRHPTCVVPGCGATVGLHAHHLRHWEDGGATELDNLVLVCPYHHRMHHRGLITITGPAPDVVVTDSAGRRLQPGSLARPPTEAPPAAASYRGPTGERADWWWYEPFQPKPPPNLN
jgi:hypothetical protein